MLPLFPHLFAMKLWEMMPWCELFWMLSFKPTFPLSSFTTIKRFFSSSLSSAISSVQLSRSIMSHDLRNHGLQNPRPPCPSPTANIYSNSCPLSQWYHPTISFSVIPFSSRFQSFPIWVFSNESVLHIRWLKILEFQPQHHSFQQIFTTFFYDGLFGSLCCPRDSQQSSPRPQVKSISSLVLSYLYSQTLTSIHDYCKNHSFD